MKQSLIHKDLRTPKYRTRIEEDLRQKESYVRKDKYKPDYREDIEETDEIDLEQMYG
ncbi:hypothetical protein UFOVP26_51 [uncultured Caudovirales phage]|uniref:Uncharacterized protein n=1 Tax=uncultured Caudovirales phage TaxID=2100421 RepID=A0A6J5KRS3_9CAUD|nr:hypothetical protein UFOVP26_51 [uncultured Caudovirales phage]CAB4123743.1 hypothetical protein UFOVP44_46 [uncultured Caudovirales phage]CAB5219145.1 hypothetical protein UFOVP220_37 [uncultured Caudovirales phage]